jgi:pimeloyl-ACP methyl ester carboxylesterase
VVVLRAAGPRVAPDPVVFLSGGPGQAALPALGAFREQPWRAARDLIIVDQRGTGLSAPLCPEAREDVLRAVARDLSTKEDLAAHREVARRCRQSLRARGVDPDRYDSAATAADLDDLRRAMGIERWNLLGISYGTRLALTAMRHHPEGIRSVVLDSVYPPGEDLYGTPSLATALERLEAECAASPDCREAGVGPEASFAALEADLASHPLVLPEGVTGLPPGPFVVNPQDLRLVVDFFIHFNEVRVALPTLLRQWQAGQTGSLAHLFSAVVGELDLGKYFAVQCREGLSHQGVPRGPAAAPRAFIDGLAEACEAWGAVPLEPRETAPVTSDIPVLLLSGEHDQRAPRDWARRAAASLPNSTLLEVSTGHGVVFHPCAAGAVAAFLSHPERRPDATCPP